MKRKKHMHIKKFFTLFLASGLILTTSSCKENTWTSSDKMKPVGTFYMDEKHFIKGRILNDSLTVKYLKKDQYYMEFYKEGVAVYRDLSIVRDSIIYPEDGIQKIGSYSPDFKRVFVRQRLYNRAE